MVQTIPEVETRAGYDAWSPSYDTYDNPLVALEQPVVSDLVGNCRGRRVADIGCGTGRWTLRMLEAGAEVTAVDFSPGMLEQLRRKLPADAALELVEHDLTQPLPLRDGSFDAVLCCLVLEHLPDLDAAMAQLARICRPGGSVIVTDLHPEMTRRGVQARYRDTTTGQKKQIAGGGHRPISHYVMAAVNAGLQIAAMHEGVADETLAATSRSGRKYLGEPLLLAMKLQRPPTTSA